MERKLLRWSWIILCLISLSWLPYPVAEAQATKPRLKSLLVEIWPEYDRAEVLVIYRAELSPDTPLPAQLTFRLPGYIESMHAVAIERDEALFAVSSEAIEMRYEGDDLLLTFPSPSPKIQFEYYDPQILTRQDQTRQLTFAFATPYDIEMTTFEVQAPFQAEDFSLTPAASNTFVGSNGLQYNLIEVAGLASGETFELSVTYKRNTTEVSVKSLRSDTAENTANITAPAEASANNLTVGYVLVGAGVGLLLGTGGYWWWSKRIKQETPSSGRRPARRKKRGAVVKSKVRQKPSASAVESARPATAAPQPGGFCYRCGSVLREDANFCHNCGAERRKT